MPYIYIEPRHNHNARVVMHIVCALRKLPNVKKKSIFNTEVNGFDHWSIIVSTDDEEVQSRIKMWCDSNEDLVCYYIETDNFWYRK